MIDTNEADTLLRSNLLDIFNESDPARRLAALSRLWADDGRMFEPDAEIRGHQAISDTVGALHGQLPPGTRFEADGDALLNHDTALLRWQAVDGSGGTVVTGVDVAQIAAGKIQSLHVFLDHPPA